MTDALVPPQPKAKVLVVDDQTLFRDGVISLLSGNDDFIVVGAAGSVHEAIRLSREHNPDIVLMDYTLPDGTGLDATQAILRYCPNCNVVILTMYESDDILLDAMRCGAKGYMLKNISGSDLNASLKGLLRGEKAISRKMMSTILDEFSRSSAGKDTTLFSNELLARLSPRELDVLHELAANATNSEIAQNLFLSENTVKHHIRNILDKIEVQNRKEAVAFARSHLFGR